VFSILPHTRQFDKFSRRKISQIKVKIISIYKHMLIDLMAREKSLLWYSMPLLSSLVLPWERRFIKIAKKTLFPIDFCLFSNTHESLTCDREKCSRETEKRFFMTLPHVPLVFVREKIKRSWTSFSCRKIFSENERSCFSWLSWERNNDHLRGKLEMWEKMFEDIVVKIANFELKIFLCQFNFSNEFFKI
jgi:hypothetical protein